MDSFKKQLDKLKAKGADIDTEKVMKDIQNPVMVKKSKFNEDSFQLSKQKVENLLNDFHEFYGPKGCSLKVQVYIGKENSADSFTEKFEYEKDKLVVFHTVEIGTKGKYEPVDCVGESVSVKDEM